MKKRCDDWRRLVGAGLAGVMLLAAGTAVGAPAAAAATGIAIKRVALFKNGLGYFVGSAVLPKGETSIRLGALPAPSLGTFWVAYPKTLKVRALFTRQEEAEERIPARSLAELLRSNLGRTVTVYTTTKDMPAVRGTVLDVLPSEQPADPPNPYRMNGPLSNPWNGRPPRGVFYNLVVIRTAAGNVALNAGSIVRADFDGGDLRSELSRTTRRPVIRLELEQPAANETLGVRFLARGITWSPSYLIDLSDPKTARLSAKAVVINEAADLRGVRLELVTGFPNIRFGDINSPVAMHENLASFLQALNRGRNNTRRSNMVAQQALAANVALSYSESFGLPVPAYSTARKGAAAEDLFFYPVEDFSLRLGETACVPLFTGEVPYRHVYTWEIPDMLDKNDRYRGRRNEEQQKLAEVVWHTCRLTNTMAMPWTTAPAEFVTGGRITGQDICYYTAPGTETTIRINRAMNVLADEAEVETTRTRNAAKFYGWSFDLVTVKGELKLQNRLAKTVTMEVTKHLSGEVKESAPAAKDTTTAKGLRQVNPRHRLVWKIKLKSGARQVLTYTYAVYVRH